MFTLNIFRLCYYQQYAYIYIYIHESNFAKFWVVPRNVQVHFIVNRETSVQIISMFSKHRVTGQQ